MTKEEYREVIRYSMLQLREFENKIHNILELCKYIDLYTTLAATLCELDDEEEKTE